MKYRVLFAEDDETIHSMIAEFLRTEGFDVDSAWDGVEAIDLLEGNTVYDMAVLDVSMPFVDGGEVLLAMAQLRPALVCKTVLISAFPDALTQEIRDRAHSVLQKPFDLDVLRASIDDVLRDAQACD
jgi:DNA-binding response OmpR family regulator